MRSPFMVAQAVARRVAAVAGLIPALAAMLTAGPAAAQVSVDFGAELPGGLPPGKSVVIRYRAIVNNPLPPGTSQVSNQGTLTGSNFSAVSTNDPATAAPADATVTLIDKADTVTTITSDNPDPSFAGEAVTVTYTVIPGGTALGSPTGMVTVTDGVDTCMGTVAAGQCTLTLTTPDALPRTLTASYAGDADFKPSMDTESHIVNPTPTPTPSSTPTATPTPSSTPTATPTATPSASPFPSATSSPTPRPCCPGDANGSGGAVNADDFLAVQANFGANNGVGGLGDANCSGGAVNANDFLAVQANFGADCG